MRHLTLFWLVVALITFSMARPAGTVYANDSVETVYLALGDSIAFGIGASRPDKAYVPRFFHYASNHTDLDRITNLAVSGETSTSFISNGQLARAVATISAPSDVQVVTLTIGGNDLLRLLTSEPCRSAPTSLACRQALVATLAGFASNYATILLMLNAALASDPGTETLLVTTYYNAFAGTGSPYEMASDLALVGSDGVIDCAANAVDPTRIGLNDLIGCIGLQTGASVVELYALFGRDALLLTHIAEGDIHPNDDGYALIASAVKNAWKQAQRDG